MMALRRRPLHAALRQSRRLRHLRAAVSGL